MATLAGLFLSAFYPTCSTLKEVGCYVLDGYQTKNLFIDSPDGLIEINHKEDDDECCNQQLNMGEWKNVSVEIKCPFPDPFKVTVHYQIPRHYVMQILMHMKATESELNIYTTVGSNSVIFIECQIPWRINQRYIG